MINNTFQVVNSFVKNSKKYVFRIKPFKQKIQDIKRIRTSAIILSIIVTSNLLLEIVY